MFRAAAHNGMLGGILTSSTTLSVAADTSAAAVTAASAVTAEGLAAGTVAACAVGLAAPTVKPLNAALHSLLAGTVRTATDTETDNRDAYKPIARISAKMNVETVAASSDLAAAEARFPAGSTDTPVATAVVGSAADDTAAATDTSAATTDRPAADLVLTSAADFKIVTGRFLESAAGLDAASDTGRAAAAARLPAGSSDPPVAGAVLGSAADADAAAAAVDPPADTVLATAAADNVLAIAAADLETAAGAAGGSVWSAAGLDTAAASDTPAAPLGSLSADTETESASDCGVADAVVRSTANPAAPAAASAGNGCYLKVLLQLDLASERCCCNLQSSSGNSNCGAKGQCIGCQSYSLNCFGSTLLLSIISRPADLAAAGLVRTAIYTRSPHATAAAAEEEDTTSGIRDCRVTAGAPADAAALATELGQQVAMALQEALHKPPDQQPLAQHCSIVHASCQCVSCQEQGSAQLLMADWVAASDLQSQQASIACQQQQANPQSLRRQLLPKPDPYPRKARKQYMQATLVSIPQAEQYSDTCSSQNSRQDGSCADVEGWYRLQTAEAFPPHTVCSMLCHRASSAAVDQGNEHGLCSSSSNQTSAARTNRHCGTTAAVAETHDHLPQAAVGSGDITCILAMGLQRVREIGGSSSSTSSSGGLLRQQQCLGVYGGLLVLGAGATTWQLLLGCYLTPS